MARQLRGLSPPGSTAPGPRSVADLGLAADDEVVRVERVRLADGVPIAFEDAAVVAEHRAVLDADLGDGLAAPAPWTALGVVATSATGHGHGPPGPRQRGGAARPARPHAALLVELRLLFDQHGRPFERTETRYVADRYVIDVVHAHP